MKYINREHTLDDLNNMEKEFLEVEREMKDMFKIVKNNRDTVAECREKTNTMFSIIDDEIKRTKMQVIRKRQNNHRKNPIKKRGDVPNSGGKKGIPTKRVQPTKKKIRTSVVRPPKKIRRKIVNPKNKRMRSPIPNSMSRRITGSRTKRVATPNLSKSRISVTPRSRKRNYVITPVRSKRDRNLYEHLNFTSQSTQVGSRPIKKRKIVAEGKREEPNFVSYKKIPQVGNVELAGYVKKPQFMWSVGANDLRRKRCFRSGVLRISNLCFVMKVLSRGERGKRHISLYVEHIPEKEEQKEEEEEEEESGENGNKDLEIEMQVCMLNSSHGDLSLGFNSMNTYNKENLSFGWSFFGSKKKILRRGNGFVFDDNTVCFDFRVKELIYSGRVLVECDD